jgi:polyhydroxyalkanoate synthase
MARQAFAPAMKMLGDMGAGLAPAKLEALRNDYLQKAMRCGRTS